MKCDEKFSVSTGITTQYNDDNSQYDNQFALYINYGVMRDILFVLRYLHNII